jgi:hypothetical protein
MHVGCIGPVSDIPISPNSYKRLLEFIRAARYFISWSLYAVPSPWAVADSKQYVVTQGVAFCMTRGYTAAPSSHIISYVKSKAIPVTGRGGL